MDVGAIETASVATTASYRSFADAACSVLDLLERHLPDTTLLLAHLDHGHNVHRIVDARDGGSFGLHANLATPLRESFCGQMADDLAPRRCDDVAAHPVFGRIEAQHQHAAASYLGVPLELSDRSRVGSLAALSRSPGRFLEEDEQLFAVLARVLSSELERESSTRDLRRMSETLRDHARGLAALGRVTRALSGATDARPAVCRAACEVAAAPVAFLLEPSGREFVSTAMVGVDIAPVTIQPRPETEPGGRAFTARQSYFVADARSHPALAAPLVDATNARSALFEPVLRGEQVAGVLILIWRHAVDTVPDAVADLLRLLAAQAAVAIEREDLRGRVGSLALSDPLTGLPSRRAWEEELPRELARGRRGETPVTVAMLDLDHLTAFNLLRGEKEGDRLVKESASAWRAQLREIDLMARLDGAEFGLVLPNCGLGEACEVLERVRASTPQGQTASAGVARWDGEEPADLLVARSMDALAAAKAAGRDMTIPAD
ncbi:MAG TPA: diguanylate cyclase [Solirubrobacteraceae bacterium]|nr:diguanylate cyclase [Solirubrobacteraceae bacterium]